MYRLLLRHLRRGGDDQSDSDEHGSPEADDGEASGAGSADGDVDGDAEADAEAEEGDGQYFWDLVPSWQYDGYYVDSGGQTTKEQERALEDIQRQAEAIEAQEHGDLPDHPDGP